MSGFERLMTTGMAVDSGASDMSALQTGPAPIATTPESVPGAAPKRRNQYKLEFKLEVANQYAPNVPGQSFEALARQYGLHKSNVMSWVAKRDSMAERLAAATSGNQPFRLDGCGRKSSHTALEDELERWVRLQTASGERVRDKDMKERAMLIFAAMHAGDAAAPDGDNTFKASSGWLARFKQRKNINATRRASRGGGDTDDKTALLAATEASACAATAAVGAPFMASPTLSPVFTPAFEPSPVAVTTLRAVVDAPPPAVAAPPSVCAVVSLPSTTTTASPALMTPATPTTPTIETTTPPRRTSLLRATRPTAPSTNATAASLSVPASLAPLVQSPRNTVTSNKRSAVTDTLAPASPASPASLTPSPRGATSPSASPAPIAPPPPVERNVVPTAWMASVDRQFSALAHQIEHLVNGQNLLMGMLQRLAPRPIASPLMTNGLRGGGATSDDDDVDMNDAARAAKRRRAL